VKPCAKTKLAIMQRKLARQVKKSKQNREKTKQKISYTLKLPTFVMMPQQVNELAKNHSEIVIENLNVSGMKIIV